MKYLIALGNPGDQYAHTIHNIGWRIADSFIAHYELESARPQARHHGTVTEGMVKRRRVSILYPTTFMNKSGVAVASFVPKAAHSAMIVIHDEVALPFGQIKISVGSRAAGHNGVQSIIDVCGTKDFIRLRVGVGGPPPTVPLERYVLSRFTVEEEALLVDIVIPKAVDALCALVTTKVEAAMTKFN